MVMIDYEPMLGSCIGEVARHATAKKKFNDKLKAAIASKCHLNTFLKTMPYIRAKDAPLVKIPVIQIAGFSAKLSALNLPKKKKNTIWRMFALFLFLNRYDNYNLSLLNTWLTLYI